jgi:expansin (peptidoglycan-binding protein)
MVVNVKINDRTVEEKDGKVVIPFNSEYSLLLKNRNDRKAVARVYIDGDEVTEKGRLIIDANSSVNLERYIDDVERGRRFKFVPLSNNKVSDKGNSEKGCIEVRFQLVKPVVNNVIVHEEHIYHHRPHWPIRYNGPFYVDYDYPLFGGTVFCNSVSKGLSSGTLNTSGNSNFTSFATSIAGAGEIKTHDDAFIQDNHLVEEKGATIKGSNSSQKFSFAYIGELESNEIVIRFQLVGTTDSNIISKYCKKHCPSCGKAYGVNDAFCSVCGVKR